MKKTVILATAAIMILAASCGNKATGSKNAANSEVDGLWTMLNGYWKYIETTDDPEELQNIFCFFGYDDENKPVSFVVWGYECSESEYVTEVTKLDEHCYRVTFEVPANKEEDGLYEMHDAYTIVRDYDLSDYSNKKFTIEFSGEISEWKYIGSTFPDDIFEIELE